MKARLALLLALLAPPKLCSADVLPSPDETLSTDCTAALATEGAWLDTHAEVFGRRAQTVVYDSKRDRLVTFGGVTRYNGGLPLPNPPMMVDGVWARPANLSAPWQTLEPSGPAPVARAFHSAIYDPEGDRMIVYGGATPQKRLGDLWELDFKTDPPAWRPLVATGTAPTARAEHSAIYDPVRRRMLVFGGVARLPNGDFNAVNETWALSLAGTPAWQRHYTMPSLAPRYEHRATYDSRRNRMIISGGLGRGGEIAAYVDVEAVDLEAMTVERLADLPQVGYSLYEHSLDYDPVQDRLLVFGGGDNFVTGVFALPLAPGSAWRKLVSAQSAGPSPRREHATWFDARRGRLAIFGGALSYDPFPNFEVLAFGRSAHVTLDPRRFHGRIDSRRPVAFVLFGAPELAVDEIDPGTIRVGVAGIDTRRGGAVIEDADGDGVNDLAFDVVGAVIGLPDGSTTAPFRAATRLGDPVCGEIAMPAVGRPMLVAASAGRVRLDSPAAATLELFDVRGRCVARTEFAGPVDGWVDPAGGRPVAPGVYWVRVAGAAEPALRLVKLKE